MVKKAYLVGIVLVLVVLLMFSSSPKDNFAISTSKAEYQTNEPIGLNLQNNYETDICLDPLKENDFLLIEVYYGDRNEWSQISSLPIVHRNCLEDSNFNKLFADDPIKWSCINIPKKSALKIDWVTDEDYCQLGSGGLYRIRQKINDNVFYSNEFRIK